MSLLQIFLRLVVLFNIVQFALADRALVDLMPSCVRVGLESPQVEGKRRDRLVAGYQFQFVLTFHLTI